MLVERSTLVRRGLRYVLEEDADITVAAEVADGREALDALSRHAVGVAVICATIDREACRAPAVASLRAKADIGIVCVGHWADTRDVDAALAAGALGCVEMGAAVETDLRNAVRRAGQGERFVSPELLDGHAAGGSRGAADCGRLTTREREILVLIARSLSTREIARTLNLSVNTVAVHRNHLMKKIGVRKATALALFAAERGLLARK